jgi:hypothetical protein
MAKIMIRVIIIALILMLFGFNDAAKTLLDGMLSIIKWVFILGVIGLVVYVIISIIKKK